MILRIVPIGVINSELNVFAEHYHRKEIVPYNAVNSMNKFLVKFIGISTFISLLIFINLYHWNSNRVAIFLFLLSARLLQTLSAVYFGRHFDVMDKLSIRIGREIQFEVVEILLIFGSIIFFRNILIGVILVFLVN